MAKLSEFVAQAKRADWVLETEAGDIVVPQPTEAVVESVSKAVEAAGEAGDSADLGGQVLRMIMGDAYDTIVSLTEDAPAGTREAIYDDLAAHFGVGNS